MVQVVATNQRRFKAPGGEEIAITYRPLSYRDALEIEYMAIGTIASAFNGALVPLFKDSKKLSEDQIFVAITEAGKSVFAAVPFSTLWTLGERLLAGCVIEGPGVIAKVEKLDDCDYFTDRIDEFALAIFWGLDVSFPRLFTLARATLARFAATRPGETSSTGSNGA